MAVVVDDDGVLFCSNPAEKVDWMSALVLLWASANGWVSLAAVFSLELLIFSISLMMRLCSLSR